MSNFPCSLTRNITSHSIKNLAFHSLLRLKMITIPTLTASLIHFDLLFYLLFFTYFFNLGVKGLKMNILPILTASLVHISLKSWENVLFEL